MSRYHRVGPTIWAQPWSDDARLLALYLLTCEHRTSEGLFRLPTAYIAEDMRWPVARIEAAYVELEQDGFVQRDASTKVVLLVNALQWQSPANANGVTAAVRKLAELPFTPLLCVLLEQADLHCARLAAGIREHLSQRLSSTCAQPLSSTSDTTPSPTPSPTTTFVEPDGPTTKEAEPVDPTVQRLCHLLADLIVQWDSKAKVAPTSKAWTKPMELLIRLDGRSPDDIERVIRWARSDSFEQANVLSPGKLRSRFTALNAKAPEPRHLQVVSDAEIVRARNAMAAERLA